MAFKVAFDAGHGGNNSTPGKRTPNNEYEWNFNNKVALAFEEELKKYENVELLRTDDRTGKTDIPLKVRTDEANKWGADIYISFHENALAGKWGSHTGTETFYSKGSIEGKKLAKLVHDASLKAYGLRDRGLKTNNLHITRETKMPAVLIEGSFMDSNTDIKKLRDDNVLRNAGGYVAQAVAEYGKLKKKKVEEKPITNESNGELYRVQTGAFSNKNNAINLSKKIENDGHNTYLIKANELFKVQVGAFGVRANADKLAKELKSKGFDAFITTESGKPVSASEPTKSQPKPQPSKPKANLVIDGSWGVSTTKALQVALGVVADGVISGQYPNDITRAIPSASFTTRTGSNMVRALQRKIGVKADGYIGANTVRALQKYLGSYVDGKISKPSAMVKELQRRLNAGMF